MCCDLHFVIINGKRLSTCLSPMVHQKPHKSIYKYTQNKFLINNYLRKNPDNYNAIIKKIEDNIKY